MNSKRFNWWNDDLLTKRNRLRYLNFLNKAVIKIKASNQVIMTARINYNMERAIYKNTIKQKKAVLEKVLFTI